MEKWEQLVTARKRKYLSQMETAGHLNVGLVTYQRWELRKRIPQPQHMRRLQEFFGELLVLNEADSSSCVMLSTTQPEEEQLPIEAQEQLLDEAPNDLQVFLQTNMSARLWSLVFQDHPTLHAKRCAIRQTIKDFDTMNANDKNYQMTRRETLSLLATLPLTTFHFTTPGTLPPSRSGSVLAQCTASLEACWELSRSNLASDLTLAFQATSQYLALLETVVRQDAQHRQEALDLATRYALLKTILSRHCAPPPEALIDAKSAVLLSRETGDFALQLSALSKLAGTYFFNKQYALAEQTAEESYHLLQAYVNTVGTEQVHPCIQGSIISTLALMQAKMGKSSEHLLQQALDIDPGNEPYPFIDFKRSSLLLDAGWISCYQGDQTQAMTFLIKRVDPETLVPKIPQSELGRIETIHVMALSSLKARDRDMAQTIHLWQAGIEGAKALKSQLLWNSLLTLYEHMEIVWPNEPCIRNLCDLITRWDQ